MALTGRNPQGLEWEAVCRAVAYAVASLVGHRRFENCIGAFQKLHRSVYKTCFARFINTFQSLEQLFQTLELRISNFEIAIPKFEIRFTIVPMRFYNRVYKVLESDM
jgi:hypothetical protein